MGHDAKGRGLSSPCADYDSVTDSSLLQQAMATVSNLLGRAPDSAATPTPGELFDAAQRRATEQKLVWVEPASDLPTVEVSFTVNDVLRRLTLEPRVTLLDALRERLALTGTKKGCNHGQCGACTVIVNGERINSCLSLACLHDGDRITTVEGVAMSDDKLHPLQTAFIEHDGFQCGYCTSGQICSALAMLSEAAAGVPSAATADVAAPEIELTDAEIRERMSGNLCRCGAYNGILAAIRQTHEQQNRALEKEVEKSAPDALLFKAV